MTGFTCNFKNDIKNVSFNDLYLDVSGNIAINAGNDEIIENCYHEIELYLGEYDFDTTLGIPWEEYLSATSPVGNNIALSIIQAVQVVKGVVKVTNIDMNLDKNNRSLEIIVYILLESGTTAQLQLQQFLGN